MDKELIDRRELGRPDYMTVALDTAFNDDETEDDDSSFDDDSDDWLYESKVPYYDRPYGGEDSHLESDYEDRMSGYYGGYGDHDY